MSLLPYWKGAEQDALKFDRILSDDDGNDGNDYDKDDTTGHGEVVHHTVLVAGAFCAWQSFLDVSWKESSPREPAIYPKERFEAIVFSPKLKKREIIIKPNVPVVR